MTTDMVLTRTIVFPVTPVKEILMLRLSPVGVLSGKGGDRTGSVYRDTSLMLLRASEDFAEDAVECTP